MKKEIHVNIELTEYCNTNIFNRSKPSIITWLQFECSVP